MSIDPTNIYVLKCREYYKIGCTSKIEKRIRGIASSLPFEIEILQNYKPTFPKMNKWDKKSAIRKVEKHLHIHLKSKRVRGEWFLLNDEDLKNIPSLIKESLLKPDNGKEKFIEVIIK